MGTRPNTKPFIFPFHAPLFVHVLAVLSVYTPVRVQARLKCVENSARLSFQAIAHFGYNKLVEQFVTQYIPIDKSLEKVYTYSHRNAKPSILACTLCTLLRQLFLVLHKNCCAIIGQFYIPVAIISKLSGGTNVQNRNC